MIDLQANRPTVHGWDGTVYPRHRARRPATAASLNSSRQIDRALYMGKVYRDEKRLIDSR